MKLFTNGTDHVVAADVDDAHEVYLAHCGEESEDCDGPFEEVPGDRPLTIICDEKGHPSDAGAKVTQRAEQWATQEPRGFLCSTEF